MPNAQFANHKSEVINLSNENVTCSNISDFPEPIFKASGGLVGSTPIICGGEKQNEGRGNNEATGFCYKLNKGKYISNLVMSLSWFEP